MNIRRITEHRELLSSKRVSRHRHFPFDDDVEIAASQNNSITTSASEGFADDDDFFESSESSAAASRSDASAERVINVDKPGTWTRHSKSRGPRRGRTKSKSCLLT